jgi:2-keto-3-deoxygluconate permease
MGNEEDVGAISIISMNDGPFLTMIALGTAGIASIPILDLISVIVPVLVGMILGNLDPEIREFLTNGGPVLIPFMGFALGTGLSLSMLINGGLAGIALGIITVIIGGLFNVFTDQAVGGSGVAGAAASSTAGNAVATPQAVAAVDPTLQNAAAVATPQVAASTVVTALLVPVFTSLVYSITHTDVNEDKLSSDGIKSVVSLINIGKSDD